jgi:hypothetical protein
MQGVYKKRGCLKRFVSLCHPELIEGLSKAINLIVNISVNSI